MTQNTAASHGVRWAFSYDLYSLMGVTPTDSNAELMAQYRRLLLTHHPDKGGDVDMFKLISAAKEILTDPALKEEYQRIRLTASARQAEPSLYEPLPAGLVHGAVAALLPHLFPPKRADERIRVQAGKHREALRALRTLPKLAAHFLPCMRLMAQRISTRNGVSFKDIFKEASHEGYDLVRNRKVDYGNMQYKSWLYQCCLADPAYQDVLAHCSEEIPTLHPLHKDTLDALENQGDIVEVLYGITRGCNFMNLYACHETYEWRAAYTDMTACCRAIDYLRAMLQGRRLKANGDVVPKQVNVALDDNSLVLGSIAYELRTRF